MSQPAPSPDGMVQPDPESAADVASIAGSHKTSEGEVQGASRLSVFMFTDLVDSSGLARQLGDADYVRFVLEPHNAIFRRILKQFPEAREIKHTGDGFMATFASASDAAQCALRFHHELRTAKWERLIPQARVGIHLGEAIEILDSDGIPMDLRGDAVNMTTRVMNVGEAGQTLLTKAAFDSARQSGRVKATGGELLWLAHGKYRFKGADEPFDVCEVGVVGESPMRAPTDSEKVKRAVSEEEAAVLGWRPAPGLEIPHRQQWLLHEKLGEGGFGEVWLAWHRRTQEQRVFKFCFDSDRLRSFKRELTFFRLIQQHLGERDDIARLYEVQVDQPPFFLESEYVSGGNLRQWCDRQGGLSKLPLEFRVTLLAQIAHAVAAAHSLGIIHKDLKPSNILMAQTSGSVRPRLCDFGIGLLADRALLDKHGITATGFTESLLRDNDSGGSGTRLYAPPESQLGKPATTAGDVYALGVMLYQFVAGDLGRPLATGWEEDINHELLRADIRTSTYRDPAGRLSSAADLAERLESLNRRAEELQTARRAEQAARRLRQLRRALIVFACTLLVVGGLCLLTFLQWRRANETEQDLAAVKTNLIRSAEADEIAGLAELHTGGIVPAEKFFQQAAARLAGESSATDLYARLEKRRDQTHRLNTFYHVADEAERTVGEGNEHDLFGQGFDEKAAKLCETGLNALYVFEHERWWTCLPDTDLEPGQQEKLKEDVYRQLILLAAIRAQGAVKKFGTPSATSACQSALAVLHLAKQFRPDSNTVNILEHFCLARMGRDDEARALPRREPRYASDYLFLGMAHVWISALPSNAVTRFLLERQVRLKQLDFRTPLDTAERYLRLAMSLEPKHYYTYYWLGRCMFLKKDLRSAELAANTGIALRPQYAPAVLDRGLVYHHLGEYDRAIEDFSQAIRLEPTSGTAYLDRSFLYNLRKDYDKAIADCTEAIRLNSKASVAHNNRGYAYSGKRQYDKAITDYTEAIRLDPTNATAYGNRAVAYDRTKAVDKAIADVTEALRLNPKNSNSYRNRGDLYGKKKEFDKAIVDYAKAIDLSPKDANVFRSRGFVHSATQAYELALRDFAEAARLQGSGVWKFNDADAIQDKAIPDAVSTVYVGYPWWKDYNIQIEAQVIRGAGEFGLCFRARLDTELIAVFGGYKNSKHVVFSSRPDQNVLRLVTGIVPGKTEPGRWYKIRIEARGPNFKVFLDGKALHTFRATDFDAGQVGLRTVSTAVRFRGISVTDPQGKVLHAGLYGVPVPGAPQ